ncbi:hypothetical protein [Zobellia uliginosa]|uniref:hypothetical protein n=1 Tax=Zobellia uliginosa TaxID=143224 RepID=UPI001C079778|nr:hypothetical protein [Zobellia uliginosa]MBU2947028.1 hypothetical protein [Zobellia uliginosa]
MKKVIFYIIIGLIYSCDYVRNQEIPDKANILEESTVCSPAAYRINKIDLKNSVPLDEWQDNLTCEGYSKRPMQQPWTPYKLLSERRKKEILQMFDFFHKNYPECKVLQDLKFEEGFFGACITEQFYQSKNEIKTSFHTMFILNKEKKVLYTIKDLN